MLGLLPLLIVLVDRSIIVQGGGWIDYLWVASMLGSACQVVRGFSAFAPCLEHVCAGGGGGG